MLCSSASLRQALEEEGWLVLLLVLVFLFFVTAYVGPNTR